MSKVKPKAAAAHRGCLTAPHWQDIRQGARLARSEGVTIIIHNVTVTVGPVTRGHQPQPQDNSTATTRGRGGHGQQLKESISKACEYPTAEQHEQQPSKRQREQQRSLLRLHDHQQAKACGARWAPLVQILLRKERAISRADVWTTHMRYRIELRDKMSGFLARALSFLRKGALASRRREIEVGRGGLHPEHYMRRLDVSCLDVVKEEVAQRDGEHRPKRRVRVEPHAIVCGKPAQPAGGECAGDLALCQTAVTNYQ